MGEPQDIRRLDPVDEIGLGLAPLKTEGERFVYDSGAGPPRQPLPRWRRRLDAVADRLRWLPTRLWWALFGDEYY